MEYNKQPVLQISTNAALADVCATLASRPYLAIDTEFHREKTYWPQLCVVQIKSEEALVLIDALAVDDLAPLKTLLLDKSITKVFHAASQDMEIFYWMCGEAPAPVHDTQIAAPLLGFAEQIGYANLVKEALGTTLPKSHSRADWTRRPIPEKQLHYALDDVIYLEKLYLQQVKSLNKRNRLHWLDDDFRELSTALKYDRPAEDMWKKMRAAQMMKGESLSILQSLAAWRESRARDADLPRTWLIKDDVLADIARQKPESRKDLEHIRGLSERTVQKHGTTLLDLITKARATKPVPLPEHAKKTKLDKTAATAVDVLQAVVSIRALENDINPTLLGPRKLLEACVSHGNSSPISGWRRGLIAEDVDGVLAGRLAIGVFDKQPGIQILGG